MPSEITITSVLKVANNQYQINYSTQLALDNLSYQISFDGISWGSVVDFIDVSNPKIITVENAVNFNIRLLSDYTPPPINNRIHTNEFNQVFN